MLKVLAIGGAVVVGVTSPAAAFQCPLLIRQLNDAAETLHATGKHAEAIAIAEKAARVLGVPLELARMAPPQEAEVRAAEQRIGR